MDIATHLSQKHLSVSVIIPARNEAPNLQHVLPLIPSFVSEVILVNGHSTDDTVTVAQDLLSTIRIVEQTGRGKGDDRKSTRLNSSHTVISYAVFCLKKKKNNK